MGLTRWARIEATSKRRADDHLAGQTTRYLSGRQAIDEGIIDEECWREVTTRPMEWHIIVGQGVKIRELMWQGLEMTRSGMI